jgi:hypothetical protein
MDEHKDNFTYGMIVFGKFILPSQKSKKKVKISLFHSVTYTYMFALNINKKNKKYYNKILLCLITKLE